MIGEMNLTIGQGIPGMTDQPSTTDSTDSIDPAQQNEQPLVDFSSGDRVRLTMRPAYFKTADPMPMLRPPDVVPVGEHGTVMERRPAGYWAVRFEQGTFLLEAQYLQDVSGEG